ncbi:hypothetical protein ILFOPFJJ_00718 [Ensifer psoraleae]|uniref:hypothetical protein n=1 Tax=Sinorhizobium psoraleae TaxID=520838 RepID=UPI001568CF03|nr:hypothetical protein [Sinorhizobium psoraleae]NRP69844.1 hypothetical protein [Sinorhizobium psoraleae]
MSMPFTARSASASSIVQLRSLLAHWRAWQASQVAQYREAPWDNPRLLKDAGLSGPRWPAGLNAARLEAVYRSHWML